MSTKIYCIIIEKIFGGIFVELIKYGPYTLFTLIGTVLTFIVAIEHIGICFLEIFGKPEQQAKAFDMDINFGQLP